MTSQLWSDTTCLHTIASNTLSCFCKQKERDKVEVSTWRGSTGASYVRPYWSSLWFSNKQHYLSLRQTMVDSWCCLDRVVPEGTSQVSKQSEVGNQNQCTVNTRPSSGTSAEDLVDFVFEGFRSSISSNAFLWKRTTCSVLIQTWSCHGKPVASAQALLQSSSGPE